jgi:hypothetical protein
VDGAVELGDGVEGVVPEAESERVQVVGLLHGHHDQRLAPLELAPQFGRRDAVGIA